MLDDVTTENPIILLLLISEERSRVGLSCYQPLSTAILHRRPIGVYSCSVHSNFGQRLQELSAAAPNIQYSRRLPERLYPSPLSATHLLLGTAEAIRIERHRG